MLTSMPSHLISQPPEELLRRWAITTTAYLGGRRNQHWLVNSGKTELVLHASPIDISYELQVQQYLRREGWPVPQLIREPTRLADKTWCLLERLSGASLEDSPAERRTRGRLLAELHGSTATATSRAGTCSSRMNGSAASSTSKRATGTTAWLTSHCPGEAIRTRSSLATRRCIRCPNSTGNCWCPCSGDGFSWA